MNVLVACECSGRVKTAFRLKGHNAWSCDLEPSEIQDDKFHYQEDVLKHLNDGWDLMIAHPPCTYLSLSGAKHLTNNLPRQEKAKLACEFFNQLLNASIPRIAIENPLQNSFARKYIRHYDQIIQPLHFGETARKATCLWLKNTPPPNGYAYLPGS